MARSMGYINVDQMLSQISAKQASEWLYFNKIEPFLEDKLLLTISHIAAVFANGFLPRKDKTKWQRTDFLPRFGLALFQKEKIDIAAKFKNILGIKSKKKEEVIPYGLEKFIKPSTRKPRRLRNV